MMTRAWIWLKRGKSAPVRTTAKGKADAPTLLAMQSPRMRMRWLLMTPLIMLLAVLTFGTDSPLLADEGPAYEAGEVVDEAAEVVDAEEEEPATVEDAIFHTDNLWIMIAGMLVFMMHLGFATLEAGMTRAKNTVNILFKNSMIICIGILSYALCGFALMYPGMDGGWVGFGGFGMTKDLADPEYMTAAYGEQFTWYTDFFFQAMFAATAATIVSGAVAERIKLGPFLIYIGLIVAIAYPISGSWGWGGGTLSEEWGFVDFAGSTIVHSVGGWAALVAVILLGPRLGKYNKDGSSNAIPGHNPVLATIGVFLLWFGWFGFNGGSVLEADPGPVSHVLTTTAIAAAAGGFTCALVSWFMASKPDLTMALNGILAGLVGITAGADLMAVWEAAAIGAIAGVIVYFSIITLDRIRIDDPVGAISVHLTCGIWGTLAVGIFGSEAGFGQLGSQVIGIAIYGAWTVGFALIVGLAIKALLGFRVSAEEETEGLDLGEHDMAAYPDFQQTYIKSYHAREM